MAQAILKMNGSIVPRRTVRRLTVSELHSRSEQQKRNNFDRAIRNKLGDSMTPTPKATFLNDDIEESDFIEPDDEVPPEIPDDDPVDSTGKAVYEQPVTDLLLNAKVFLPQGEELKSATVKYRSRDDNGDVVGECDPNPYLNTLEVLRFFIAKSNCFSSKSSKSWTVTSPSLARR